MKPITLVSRYVAALFLALAVAACASVSVDTFNKKLASAYVGVATAAQMTGTAAEAGKITQAQKADVAAKLTTILSALRAAETTHLADPVAGDSRLTTAITAITALQAFLATQGVK